MNTAEEEKLVRELMNKTVQEMPFADFEDRMMERIHNKANASRSFLKDIRLSWFFFIVGTLFGLLINLIVANMNQTIFGIPGQRFILVIQALFVILLLSQFDRLVALTKSGGNQKKKMSNFDHKLFER